MTSPAKSEMVLLFTGGLFDSNHYYHEDRSDNKMFIIKGSLFVLVDF